jgi:hypothetical protein
MISAEISLYFCAIAPLVPLLEKLKAALFSRQDSTKAHIF